MTVVIIDLDTLADSSWRADHGGDWDSYHAKLIDDPPDLRLLPFVLGLYRVGATVELITERPEKWMLLTQRWLMKHEVRGHGLTMRAADDWRSAIEVKAGLASWADAHVLITHHPELITLARDRNPQIVGMEVLR